MLLSIQQEPPGAVIERVRKVCSVVDRHHAKYYVVFEEGGNLSAVRIVGKRHEAIC
ncbi:MAG: hypothetical protein IH975_02720 [Nitrospinae bacterium]|nr:hypothetical protein [Nitrospinota bacterium]